MTQNYSGWSVVRLKKERNRIDKAIQTAEKRDKKATLAKMVHLAKQNGFELHELISGLNETKLFKKKSRAIVQSGKRRGKVAPKYCHPSDPSQTWTGRGRKPLWVKESLESGAALEDLRISTSTG